jgi:hypothetical protein
VPKKKEKKDHKELQQVRSIRENEQSQISVFPFNFIDITWGRFDHRRLCRVKNMLAMYLKYHKAGLTPTTLVTSTAIPLSKCR